MKKLDFGQTLGLIANVGVIAGIVFLGIEIRDSNTQARIATTQEASANLSGWRTFVAADPELTEIYTKGLADFSQLSSNERGRFDLLMHALMQTFGAALVARNEGLVTMSPGRELEERVLEGEVFALLDQPGFVEWWETTDRRGIQFSLVGLIDALHTRKEQE